MTIAVARGVKQQNKQTVCLVVEYISSIFSAISEEEKENIRQKLLGNFNEPSAQVCTQMAVLIAKIARLDCPRFWPTLLPTLLQSIQSQEQLLQERSLLVLHHVIKTLASKRLGADRKVFEDVS